MYASALNLVCGLIVPGFASTWPRSTSSRLVPRSSTPTLSPASPWSSSEADHLNVVLASAAGGEADDAFADARVPRSEGRRVGKDGVSPCHSRWSPYH